jgi:hypothetical protein
MTGVLYMSKNKVIEILMKRDGMTLKEAKLLYNEIRKEVYECLDIGDYCAVEEILLDHGFEMDYIVDILY